MLEPGAGGDAETQVFGDVGHRGDQHQRIVDRHLRSLADGGFVAGTVDVVGAQDVGDEQPVEAAALQQRRELGPVGQVCVGGGPVVGVSPEAGGLVGDAVHVERVEADGAGHWQDFRRRPAGEHCFASPRFELSVPAVTLIP
jgi:hypothetical protein